MAADTEYTAIINGRVLINRTLVPDAVVIVCDGRIEGVGVAGEITIPRNAAVINAQEGYVVPGFIDILIHGFGGCRPEDNATGMARQIIQQGTTYCLPSLISNELEAMLPAIDHIRQGVGPVEGGATIGGIHLEGPFLNPKYGAQRAETNVAPDEASVRQLIDRCGDHLKMMTIAPERPGALAAIRTCRAVGATVSIGHSDATEEEYLAGREAGITHATHLFNAMATQQWPTSETYAGVKLVAIEEFILADDAISVDIVCDSSCTHVHPALLKIALKCKAPEKLTLVTDAMPVAGLPPGEQKMADGQTAVTSEDDDVAYLTDGTLCGSAMSLCGALNNFITHTSTSLETALVTVTEGPARAIGIFDRKGSIASGKDADLVFLDRDHQVTSVMINGHIEYNKQRS